MYHGGAGAAAGLGGAGAAGGTFAAKLATGVSAALPGSPASVGGAGVAGSTGTAQHGGRSRPSPAYAPPESGAVEGTSATQAAAAARLAAKQAWGGTGAVPPVWRPPTQTLQMLPDVWEEHPKVEVTAEIHGPFAVYKDIKGIGYTLGHVASQYPMATGFATKDDAVAASQEAAASSVDWSYSNKTELKANAKNFKAAAALGTKLKQAAQRSRQPKVESTAAPAWTPPGGEATFASLTAHEQAIHAAYSAGEGFTTQTPLPAVALQSVAAYQDGKYQPMNDSLWHNTKPTPSIASHIANLDRVMAVASVPFNMTVVRSHSANSPLYTLMAKLNGRRRLRMPGLRQRLDQQKQYLGRRQRQSDLPCPERDQGDLHELVEQERHGRQLPQQLPVGVRVFVRAELALEGGGQGGEQQREHCGDGRADQPGQSNGERSMSTNSEDERRQDADQSDEEAPDDDATLEWPQPLSSEERSRIEAKTWNWNAVKIYPGGTGPGVPFSTYAAGDAPQGSAAEPADDGAVEIRWSRRY